MTKDEQRRTKIKQRKHRKKLKANNIKKIEIYIDEEIKRNFKIKCIRNNITMQKKINELIKNYLVTW